MPFLHVPIDKYILKIARNELGLAEPNKPWGKWGEGEYLKYQNKLTEKIEKNGYVPFEWELRSWLREARNFSDNDND